MWAVIQARDALVKVRTMLVNQARGMAKSCGARLTGCSSHVFNKRTWGQVPEDLRPALAPIYEQILSLTQAIDEMENKVSAAVKSRPSAELLAQIPGVGQLTALAYVLALGNVNRFERSRDVGAYFGLVPKKRASGDHDPQLGISKRGNGTVRRLLVCAAHYILGPFNRMESDLRSFGLRIAGSGNDSKRKRRAVVAVARKLAVAMAAVVKSGKPFELIRAKKDRVSA
jgi:transposase